MLFLQILRKRVHPACCAVLCRQINMPQTRHRSSSSREAYPRSEVSGRCTVTLFGVLLLLLVKLETRRRLLTADCWSSSLSSPGLRFVGLRI